MLHTNPEFFLCIFMSQLVQIHIPILVQFELTTLNWRPFIIFVLKVQIVCVLADFLKSNWKITLAPLCKFFHLFLWSHTIIIQFIHASYILYVFYNFNLIKLGIYVIISFCTTILDIKESEFQFQVKILSDILPAYLLWALFKIKGKIAYRVLQFYFLF